MVFGKFWSLPGGDSAYSTVPVNPDTGNPRLSRTALDVALGFVPGAVGVTLNAFRAALPNSVETVIEEISRGLLVSSAGVAMTIRSTSAADVGPVVRALALGAGYSQLAGTNIVLNGTTQVSILAGTPLTRINTLVRVSGDFVGNVLVESGGVTYGFIAAGQQIQRSSRYTVPAGFRFFLTDGMSALAKDTGVAIGCVTALQIKPTASIGFGNLFALNLRSDGTSTAPFGLTCPQGLTGPIDLQATAIATTVGMDVQALINGVLQDLSVGA